MLQTPENAPKSENKRMTETHITSLRNVYRSPSHTCTLPGANDGTIIAMYDQRKQGNHAQYKKTMV